MRNSVIGSGVKIMKGAEVSDSVIMEECVIGAGAQVRYSILGENVTVGNNSRIGAEPGGKPKGITVIGAGISVPDDSVIKDGEMLSVAK